MGRVEAEIAEMNLRAAERLYAMEQTNPDPMVRLEAAGKVLRERTALDFERQRLRIEERAAADVILSALAEHCDSLVRGSVLLQVRQSHARFTATENSADGWEWPVRIMQSGFAGGRVDGPHGQINMPHYFPREIVAEVAQAAEGGRFRRKHPDAGDGSDAPELIAGWLSDARMDGTAAFATVNLLHSAADIRSTLLAAREAGKMNLFGVSILAYFGFAKSQAEGRQALVAMGLQRFVALDMCGEPGAGGRFIAGAS